MRCRGAAETISWFSMPTAVYALQPTTPNHGPLVTIERQSGSVSEICWSGAGNTCFPWHRTWPSPISVLLTSLSSGSSSARPFPTVPAGSAVSSRDITREALLRLTCAFDATDLSSREDQGLCPLPTKSNMRSKVTTARDSTQHLQGRSRRRLDANAPRSDDWSAGSGDRSGEQGTSEKCG